MNKTTLFQGRAAGALLPFILITTCFALWGFANDITNPMVKAFSKIFRMSVTDGTLVQVAFYGGYFVMAFPAALFIRRFSYKAGVLTGLGLYAAGAFLFYPAMLSGAFFPFLIAYFILTCGLSFLETSCNPYILAMGPEATATRRLNLAQAFNPVGSLLGMWVAMTFIQARLNPLDSASRATLGDAEFASLRDADLEVLISPYMAIGIAVVVMLVLVLFCRMPGNKDAANPGSLRESLRRLLHRRRYREGVIAQFFYVGTQIMCWTFIIQYGTRLFMLQGMEEKAAEILSQKYNIAAMLLFCVSRFLCTWLMRYVAAPKLLAFFAAAAILLTGGVVMADGVAGLWCLVGVSGCMSLMFPTIYGIALTGVGNDAKLGAAGLIMAILGGSVLPPLQARIIDAGTVWGLRSTNVSFLLPMLCFLVVLLYALRQREKGCLGC